MFPSSLSFLVDLQLLGYHLHILFSFTQTPGSGIFSGSSLLLVFPLQIFSVFVVVILLHMLMRLSIRSYYIALCLLPPSL